VPVDPATMAGIETAFKAWLKRCSARKDNIALFYFAGHGLSTATQFLLASDFYDPAEPKRWKNSIDFTGFQLGMRLCPAQTQLFFADACRENPIDALLQVGAAGNPLIDGGIVPRPAPAPALGTYFAAADGLKAYGPVAGPTYFATALLDGLEGAGATRTGGAWRVDTFLARQRPRSDHSPPRRRARPAAPHLQPYPARAPRPDPLPGPPARPHPDRVQERPTRVTNSS